MPALKNTVIFYWHLMRLDRPIGIFLLLWPTLIALWIASGGWPETHLLFIFITGTVLSRSAACVVNDWVDRDFDPHVARTQHRPLARHNVKALPVLTCTAVIFILDFFLIWGCNFLTKQLAVCAVLLAVTYPFFKRFFPFPQLYLGLAYSAGIPLAFAAVQNTVPLVAWILFIANMFWIFSYDTAYALVDLADDTRLGLHSSARTLGRFSVFAIHISYGCFLLLLAYLGYDLKLSWPYWLAYLGAVLWISYYSYLLLQQHYFTVFLKNNYLGITLLIGIIGSFA